MTEPEPVTVEAVDCGRVLEIDTGPTTLTLTRGQRGEVTVYEGDYEDREGMMARLTLVVVETDGLAFEPAVVVRMRGEAVPLGNPEFRVPITLTLQRLSPEAARACECALMGRYYERIMQYREIFADDALMEEARSRDLGLQDFKVFVNDVRMERRASFDASLGRTAADEIPGGGGSTNPEGAIHVDDLAMLERGVPPALIESVHVHEEVHQAERLGGTALTTREILAQEEVAASEAQLAFIEGWLQEHCPRWEAPTRVF